MANNPRHGDEIIRSAISSLGGEKLIASQQFQEFLDDLGRLLIANETTGDDERQESVASLSAIESKITSLANIVNIFNDNLQEIYTSKSEISQLNTEVRRLNMIIEANSQSFAIMESNLANFVNQVSNMNSKLDDLEQLENVN